MDALGLLYLLHDLRMLRRKEEEEGITTHT